MKGLRGWMRLVEGNHAAVLSSLLKELDRITASDETSAAQLAKVILNDASLTSNVVRIANSVTYNPSPIPVTTVSRAILNIGFKHIRSVCLSIKVLETVLKENPSPLLVAMLAKSLHGAAQAKALCGNLADARQEEVFVASLMSQLAELLVLGSGEQEVKELCSFMDAQSTSEDKNRVAEKYLGVSFNRLSKTLMKQWRIEGIVHEVLSSTSEPTQMVQAVLLGEEISRAALFGWKSPEFLDVIKRVAEFKGAKVEEVRKSLLGTADEVAASIAVYGRGLLTGYIPTSAKGADRMKSGSTQESGDLAGPLMPDPALQRKVLLELTELMEQPFNINTIFKSILIGLNKGAGLERVALAIFDKEHQKVVAKYVEGSGTEKWREVFILRYVKSHSGFLYNLFEKDQLVWVGNPDYRSISQYLTSEYSGITGTSLFFIAPLKAKGKRIGFLYADMGVTNRDLSQNYFAGFCLFAQQLRKALEILASR